MIDSIAFSYNNKDNILKNISFSIDYNQHIGLKGHNGLGKTTLVKLMLGILKPKHGDIFLEGKNIRDISLSDIGKKVGYIFQNPEKQLFCPTVWEQMNFSYRNCESIDKNRIEEKLMRYLEEFDLRKYKDNSPFTLSGGEKQRLVLASVLSRDVDFLILDEPTIGLDILRTAQLGKYLNKLRDEGKGYLIISHDKGFLSTHVEKTMTLGAKGVEFS
ncbi:MAG: ABC transporter ATP-binding protein [Tissierellales bacterium]